MKLIHRCCGVKTVERCSRCEGIVAEDRQWDLPGGLREFCCLNCGDRYWINLCIFGGYRSFLAVYPN